jgi:hypothetical protein
MCKCTTIGDHAFKEVISKTTKTHNLFTQYPNYTYFVDEAHNEFGNFSINICNFINSK